MAASDAPDSPAPVPVPVPVSNEAVARTYDAASVAYDYLVAPLERPERLLGTVLLDLERGERVCDLGCGPGHALPRFVDCVGEEGAVFGLDAAPGMLARAARRVRRAGAADRVTLLVGDARRLPFADGSLDAVFLAETLELFADPDAERALAEIRRALGPDGRLCVTSMDLTGREDTAFVRGYEWAYRHVPGVDRLGCRPIPVAATLRRAGFRVDAVERGTRLGVWPTTVALARPSTADTPESGPGP
ncbi:MAG: class I SAM-dependent methyltransferase [Haloarculaceae archaeon]